MLSDQDALIEEIAYLGTRMHWPLSELLDLEHPLRRRFAREAERLEARLAGG